MLEGRRRCCGQHRAIYTLPSHTVTWGGVYSTTIVMSLLSLSSLLSIVLELKIPLTRFDVDLRRSFGREIINKTLLACLVKPSSRPQLRHPIIIAIMHIDTVGGHPAVVQGILNRSIPILAQSCNVECLNLRGFPPLEPHLGQARRVHLSSSSIWPVRRRSCR